MDNGDYVLQTPISSVLDMITHIRERTKVHVATKRQVHLEKQRAKQAFVLNVN